MSLKLLILILSMLAITPIEASELAEGSKAKRVRLSILPSLPQDVTVSIFGFIDYLSLARSRQICKLWKTLIDEKLPLPQRYILKYLAQFVQKKNPERTIERFKEIFLVPLSSESTGKTALDDIIEELQEELNVNKEQTYQALWSSQLVNTCPSIRLEIYAGNKREVERELAFPYISANLFKQEDLEHVEDQDRELRITVQHDSPMHIFGIGNLPGKILDRVREVRLYKITLLKIPRQLQKLSRLAKFMLTNSQLSSTPAEIGQLANLQWLFLDHNQLSSVSTKIYQLTKLQELYLQNNLLSSIPAEMGQLTNLQGLYLHNNQLSCMPPEIGQLTNLNYLYLHTNQLSSIPVEIGRLTNLQQLYLYNNQLSSIPVEIKEALPNCTIEI